MLDLLLLIIINDTSQDKKNSMIIQTWLEITWKIFNKNLLLFSMLKKYLIFEKKYLQYMADERKIKANKKN